MTTVAKMSWYSRWDNHFPCFYENIGGKMKRVSEKRGFELVDARILPLTDQLRQYKERGVLTLKEILSRQNN